MSHTRILHVMDKLSVEGSKIAGPARQLVYRVPSYPKDRYSVLVCSLRRDESTREFFTQHGVDAVCLGRSKFDVRVLGDLRRLVNQWEPTLLHLHGYASWTFGRIVGRSKGIPVVVQEHFVEDRVLAIQQVADWVLRGQQQLGLAVSESVKEFMVNQRYIRGTPIEVIWNGVPVEKIRQGASAADTAQLRDSLGIPADAPLVGTVGRLAEMKGHEYFLEAAARIRSASPDAHFVIVGEGPRRAFLEEQAARLGLAESVHFVGHQSDVVPYYAMFTVCLLTSVYGEGFHTVAAESLAAGTPVVMTDLDVYRALYSDEHDVLKVPIRDPGAAAAAVLRLLSSPDLQKDLLVNAQDLLDACSLDAIVERYLDIYRRVLREYH